MRRRCSRPVALAAFASALFAFVLPILSAADEWELLSDDDGIKVYRKEIADSPVVAFRGEAVVDATVAKVTMVLDDTSRKKEWVANVVEARDIRQISPTERIEYNRTGAPWPIKDRDFVFHAKAEIDKQKKRLVLTLKSVTDPKCPENEDEAVRGELLASSYVLQAIEGGKKTHLTVEILADPKGSIPKWVVNLFQKGWPRKTITGIREQCAKADVKEHALVKAAFDEIFATKPNAAQPAATAPR